jgi:hypothetical protein
MSNIVILSVGKIWNIKSLIGLYKDCQYPVVVSALGLKDSQIIALKDANFHVITNPDVESSYYSIEVQLRTILPGLKYIKDNFSNPIIIKTRNDIYPLDLKKFLTFVEQNLPREEILQSLGSIYWDEKRHIIDQIIIGHFKDMENFYSNINPRLHICVEICLLLNYEANYQKTIDNIQFIGEKMLSLGIDFVWYRDRIAHKYFTAYHSKFIPNYKLRNDNCEDFPQLWMFLIGEFYLSRKNPSKVIKTSEKSWWQIRAERRLK